MYSIQLQSNGDVIEVTRTTTAERSTNYATYNNSLRPEVLNKDIDRIWLKMQELGVADWILQNHIDSLKKYVDQSDQDLQSNINNLKDYVDQKDTQLQNNIEGLKFYVDEKDNELRNYLINEIQKQGIALDQLEDYYNYLLQRLAQIAVGKGWDASFVVDGNKTQKEINDLLAHEYYVENWRC